MSKLWTVYKDDLIKVKCIICNENEELYSLDGEIICRTCLENEEVEESEELTLEERNT